MMAPKEPTRRVAVVAYDGVELLDVACVTSTLFMANRLSGRELYRVEVLTPGGRSVRCDSGLRVSSDGSLQQVTGPLDTLIVSGGLGHSRSAGEPTVVAHVKRLAAVSRRVASVCTGATVLAAAGLLDGKRATTHWFYASELAERYPEIEVDPGPVYIRDGSIATSGGVTSAIDLTLALLQEDHGIALARQVSRGLVVYLQRPGTQAQVSPFTSPDSTHAVLRDLVLHIRTCLDAPLDVPALARRAGLSERQLHRLFVDHMGASPGRAVRQLRLEAARQMLVPDRRPIAEIARLCGFTNAESFRQAFVREFGLSPTQYRNAVPQMST